MSETAGPCIQLIQHMNIGGQFIFQVMLLTFSVLSPMPEDRRTMHKVTVSWKYTFFKPLPRPPRDGCTDVSLQIC